ncbi:hypothetical protein GCM10023339_40430 [Alloalcanivorax gelatiniphagus]
MTEVLMTCAACEEEIAVDMAAAILRMDVEPRACAELLFACPACASHCVRRIAGDLLTLLLFVGVKPLTLSEPRPDPADAAPSHAPVTLDELLDWHEQLAAGDYLAAHLDERS